MCASTGEWSGPTADKHTGARGECVPGLSLVCGEFSRQVDHKSRRAHLGTLRHRLWILCPAFLGAHISTDTNKADTSWHFGDAIEPAFPNYGHLGILHGKLCRQIDCARVENAYRPAYHDGKPTREAKKWGRSVLPLGCMSVPVQPNSLTAPRSLIAKLIHTER